MTLAERIEQIRVGLIVRDDDADLVHEVRGLHDILGDGLYRQKIRDAGHWAEVYIDPKERAKWDSGLESGREVVKRFLSNDLADAAKRARKLLEA